MADIFEMIRAAVIDEFHVLADKANKKAFEFDMAFDPESQLTEEYAKKEKEAERAQFRLEGASMVLQAMDRAIRIARKMRGEDVYKADRERWADQQKEASGHVVGHAARALTLARAVEKMKVTDDDDSETKH
jgi:hypothetical protein